MNLHESGETRESQDKSKRGKVEEKRDGKKRIVKREEKWRERASEENSIWESDARLSQEPHELARFS
jgi:hypothetical protein